MARSIVLLTTFLLASFMSKCQDLTGTWEGSVMGEYCKLVVLHINDSLYGYTYDTGLGYCKADFVGKYNSTTKKLKGKNTRFIEHTILHGKSIYRLTYSKRGNHEFLKGIVAAKTVSGKLASLGLPMPISYSRTKQTIDTTKFLAATIRFHDSIMASSTAAKNSPLPVAAGSTEKNAIETTAGAIAAEQKITDSVTAIKESRTSVIQRSLITKADTVKITLYDDGDIDGDIVTIFDNGKVIANKLALTKEPYHITLLLPHNGSKHTIELMAENEGSIPPNTAYMLVVAGNERVEVKAASDKLSNAAIVIQKEE